MKTVAIIFALFALFAASKAQNCASCELVIGMIETWVEANATESQILQYLETVCTLFPQYQATCDQIASQSLSEIIGYLQDDETPSQVCTQLGMCTSEARSFFIALQDVHKLKNLPKPIKSSFKNDKQDVECGSCENVISVIEEWLDQSNNQQEVISAIEVVCTYMPGWDTTCDAIISAGVPTVVTWIETYENSTMVCNQLGLCGSTEEKPVPVIHVTDDCGECQQIIATVENYLASNTSESAIETYLDIACTVIPQWTTICETVISQELPQIIDMIEQQESPVTICTTLGLCSSKPMIFAY